MWKMGSNKILVLGHTKIRKGKPRLISTDNVKNDLKHDGIGNWWEQESEICIKRGQILMVIEPMMMMII